MKKYYSLCSAFILAVFSASVFAETETKSYVVNQKDKKFSEEKLKIKVGDSIDFKNDDPWFHNVFSLSDVQNFDLGSYPKGQFKTVTFNKEGKLDVECAIHPQMHMVVEVTK